jgi:DNA processing protein
MIVQRQLSRRRLPVSLQEIPDPPEQLYLVGPLSLEDKPSIAMVGSRAASWQGLRFAEQLAREIAALGMVVISGLARGIDTASHQGALAVGGKTIAVLGQGCDITYPRQNANLHQTVASQGLLVSEYPPGTPPKGYHFPARNRLITGLCDALIVVEAKKRSGSLISAQWALEQGKEVFAVPGNVDTGAASGCHALIRDGAHLLESITDLIAVLPHLLPAPARRLSPQSIGAPLAHWSPLQKTIWSLLASGPLTANLLLDHLAVSVAHFTQAMHGLESEGSITRDQIGYHRTIN